MAFTLVLGIPLEPPQLIIAADDEQALLPTIGAPIHREKYIQQMSRDVTKVMPLDVDVLWRWSPGPTPFDRPLMYPHARPSLVHHLVAQTLFIADSRCILEGL